MTDTVNSVKEGDIHTVINIEGKTFEIRYGYYDDCEREKWDPIPIYPDFLKNPIYTNEGYPFVTRTQDPCSHYISKRVRSDNWCADCIYFSDEKQEIGICKCKNNTIDIGN